MPLIGKGVGLLMEHGIYEGEFFRDWIAEKLAARRITRFGQLVDEEAEAPRNRWWLKVIASDVTCRRMLVLPQDAEHLGIEPDEMEIADAVRMSMSIPLFFEPVVHKDPDGERHVIADNAVQLPGLAVRPPRTASRAGRRSGCCSSSRSHASRSDTGCGARTTGQGAGRSSTTSGGSRRR